MDKTTHLDFYNHLEKLFDDKLNMIFTNQPATIKSFNKDENTVDVILDKEGWELRDIPISLFGNPSSYITTPTLEAGTKGLLCFSKHDLYSWAEDGVDPHAKTDYSKNNAFFLIGATNQLNKVNYNTEAIEIKTDKAIELKSQKHTSINSEKEIKFTSPKIRLIDSNNGNELFDLLGETLDLMQKLATDLVSTKTSLHGESLTKAPSFAELSISFGELSEKYKGFNECKILE